MNIQLSPKAAKGIALARANHNSTRPDHQQIKSDQEYLEWFTNYTAESWYESFAPAAAEEKAAGVDVQAELAKLDPKFRDVCAGLIERHTKLAVKPS